MEILHIKGKHITSLLRLKLDLKVGSGLAVTKDAFWVCGTSHAIFRIDKKDGAVKHFSIPGSENMVLPVFTSPNGDIWITTCTKKLSGLRKYSNAIYQWNHQTGAFVTNPYKPANWNDSELSYATAFQDAKGNVLLSYRDKNNVPSATLLDTQGRLYDYSAVMSRHELAYSEDFKQGVIFHMPGLRVVEVTQRSAVKKVLGIINPRQILELDPRTVFVCALGGSLNYLSNNNGTWVGKEYPKHFLHFALTETKDIVRDAQGDFWFLGNLPPHNLMRYRTTKSLCDTFNFDNNVFNIPNHDFRVDFQQDGQMVIFNDDAVYVWDKKSKTPSLLIKTAPLQKVNQILAGRAGYSWLASGDGLIKIDPKNKSQQVIDLIPGRAINVQRLHQDKKGRLWVATAANGIVLYDPASGQRQVIDQEKGLSSNIVVTLLEDNEGNIWAGTYYGITVLSPDGVVIDRLYEADGLANNEFNRWSALKMQDGRLCFGSVVGVTIIDPEAWKASREGRAPIHIYLTELYRDTPGEATNQLDLLPLWQQNQRIVFPAASRSLKIAFALSNYASPETSIFAYKIEGTDQDWHYINAQNQLSLNALPTGSYNILIKGSGGKGRWSEPLVIPIRVGEFFYKQWWFFVLCALPFLGFLGLWIHRQRGERKRLEREVEIRTHTIQEQADKLLVADQMKTRLYTNITHEFRTPLTVISGMADMMKTMPDKAPELIKRNSEGLLRLVNQMLDLAKLESGQLQVEPVQIDVVPYIQYLFESFQSYAEGKNIELVFQKDMDQLVMDCDEKKLESIVTNLLSNAIKFSGENRQVVLSIEEEKGQFLIRVADQGIGIPPDKQAHVFDRFYQVDNSTTRKGEGTGIGLTLTKELVELMGGTIRVQSPGREGKGTEFTVSLPITHLAGAAAQAQFDQFDSTPTIASTGLTSNHPVTTPEDSSLITHHSSLSFPLLLLIEDNIDVVTYMKACLQDRYTIEWAANGAIGIERALETIPDIIISDIMMPEKDGYEVCYTLKNDERTSHIPIILLTAKANIDSRLKGLRRGADAYLGKPFLKEELYIRLEQLLELRRKLQAHYARIDFSARAATDPLQTEQTPDDHFIRKAARFVQDHLDELTFRVEDLCMEMAMSESQLNRKLKALSGKTASPFIRNIRLQEARKLLQTTDQNISEIAYAVGFSDPLYFSRAFSQEFGVAPSAFRK
ncbi:MAG: helix-turn-helix domain-containing protein [Bacteroidetes bacterium]|nr:MAG: helix-turn-helix domain-containing protein [Bacteroidota bacterium]